MGGILLGNLYVKDIEKRLNIQLSDSERKFLKNTHQDEASNIKKNSWHCFDMPFVIHCGNKEITEKIVEILTPYENQMESQIRIYNIGD